MNAMPLYPAFDEPVAQSQQVFRTLLKCMSEPGEIGAAPAHCIETHPDTPCLHASTWCIARALFDMDTVIYLSPALESEALVRSIQFQTEARVTSIKQDADFAILTLEELVDVSAHKLGTLDSPHDSCTFLVQVSDLGMAPEYTLCGPGIKDTRNVCIAGLDAAHLELMSSNHAIYPCGSDFIFCAHNEFMALPRTTRITAGPSATSEEATTGDTTCM